MASRWRLLLEMAISQLSRRLRQTLVAVAGVMVGVGFFLAVSAMMVGSQNDFIATLINSAPHIIISDELRSPAPQPGVRANPGAAVALHGYRRRNEVRGLHDWQRIMAAAAAMPGVVASPSLAGAVTLKVGGRQVPLAILGVEPGLERRVSTVEEYLEAGRLADLETSRGAIIIGRELADSLGLALGDSVAATSATGPATLKIVGLVQKGRGQLGGAGYMLLREAQSLTGQPFIINRIGLKLPDPQAAETIAAGLEQRFFYKTESWQERSADVMALLVTRNVIMYSVVSAILLVASFGIYTVVSNAVIDKRRDIAILRAMGFSEADLQGLFVLQGLIVALLGVALGFALGAALMGILGSLEFELQGRVRHLPLDDSARQFIIAGAASMLAAVVAAWLPARKVARLDPVDILRGAA